MKTFLIILSLLLVTILPIPGVSAESGPPPMQEVEATGQGINADEAFKQAVIDAVRQVVGTLVSAENVINNERVIKDEVLTLSKGFVEKVLKQDKRNLSDGTWEVRLKCVVRKGQVYGKLQEAKVPTVKVDGVSLYADVVSQINVQKESTRVLAKAFDEFSMHLITAKVLDEKPPVLRRDDKATVINLNCQAVCDMDRYFSQLAPNLDATLSKVCLRQLTKKEINEMSYDYNIQSNAGGYIVGLPVKGGKNFKKWSYNYYVLDKRLFEEMPRWGTFKDRSRSGRAHTTTFVSDTFKVWALFIDSDGKTQFLQDVGELYFSSLGNCHFSFMPLMDNGSRNQKERSSLELFEWKHAVELPTSILSKVASIKLVIARPAQYWPKAVLRPNYIYLFENSTELPPGAWKFGGERRFEPFGPILIRGIGLPNFKKPVPEFVVLKDDIEFRMESGLMEFLP